MILTDTTIVAPATAPAIGAIALVRLSGDKAITIANAIFKGKNLEKQVGNTVHFGKIIDGETIIDEVLVAIFKAPKSYTAEDVVEISCHGSPYIVQQIIRLCLQNGAVLAQPGEFTQRAFLNGQLDLSQAEAVADVIAANSAAAHKIALQQLRGGFSHNLNALRQQLIDFCALIELELDFGEEDVEFANRPQLLNLLNQISAEVSSLLQSFTLGNAIKNGVNTVIAGRPNAGKSTLLNALLNEERAIVSDIAGTTRDTIEEVLNINGVDFRLVDTAGIREAQDTIEQIGVQRTFDKIEQSAVLLFLVDGHTADEQSIVQDLQQLPSTGTKTLLVINKIDEYAHTKDVFKHIATAHAIDYIEISAKNKENLQALLQTLYDVGVGTTLPADGVVVANMRHAEALEKALESLDLAKNQLQSFTSGEILAFELREAMHHIGSITGQVSTDDLLGSIFSRFCIGK